MQQFTSNNYSRNLRITETPRAIRNNQYSMYAGKFITEPNNRTNPLPSQKICSVYRSSGGLVRPCHIPCDPNMICSIQACLTGNILNLENEEFREARFSFDILAKNTKGYNGYAWDFKSDGSGWLDSGAILTTLNNNEILLGFGLNVLEYQIRVRPIKWVDTPENIVEYGEFTESPVLTPDSLICL